MISDILAPLALQLRSTPQEPSWHGEGDVYCHTLLVCQAMGALPEYRQADPAAQHLLMLAAALHDIGKPHTTRQENGLLVAPGHARLGAQLARQMLWAEFSGSTGQALREGVCALIRYHSLPLHAIDEPDGKLRLLRFAANGALAPGITVKNLCTLAQADVLGRLCPDREALLEKIGLCRELAREAGCYDGPYPFPDGHTRFAVLSGRRVPMEYPLYDGSWGQVILLSGLPGTGKDTWIQASCPDLPVISLDDIRREKGIPPTDNQSAVIEAAREQAKKYLRTKQSFVWNSTNLSVQVRSRQAALFTDYGASCRMVYLETDWQTQLRRNAGREAAVPEAAIGRMLEILSPPDAWEAARVDWLCV